MNARTLVGTISAIGLCATAATSARAECFTPLDKTPGWKKVALIAAAPWLAASGAQHQFRSNETALIWAEDSVIYRGSGRAHPGRTDYTFQLLEDRVRRIDVDFEHDLDGAKVDSTGWAGVSYPVSHHQRQGGSHISVAWPGPSFSELTLSVHKHLRHTPVVRRVRGAYTAVVSHEDWLPPAFRGGRALYYLQPAGVDVSLCMLRNHDFEIARAAVVGTPVPVALTPQ